MSSAAIPPASVPSAALRPAARGATALGPGSAGGAVPAQGHRHFVGNALRAIKVFAGAAFSVAVLGEYAED